MVPRVGRRQDSAQCTRGSAWFSLSGASTATGPDCYSELGRAAPPASVPPGASAARSLGVGCRPPRRRRDGRPVRCRDARIGPWPPLQGRAAALAGPGARGAFLEIAGERALDWRLLGSRPAWAAPVRASKRGCAVRSGLSKGPGQVAGEHSFVRDSERLARKDNDGPVALAALRKESPMTDLITAARQGNGPRVEVAPHMVVAGFRGLGQLACCCRSVASTRASRFHGRSFHLGLRLSSHIVLCRSS